MRSLTEYFDAGRRVVVRSDLNALGDGKTVSVQHYDQLGRVRLSRALEDAATQDAADETAGIKTQTRYAYAGSNSYVLTSNPYRAATSDAAGGESTMGWTLTAADRGGRVIRIETFDGAPPPAPFAANSPNDSSTGAVVTSYDADSVTVTDQAGRQRRSVSDALGRLAQVFEAPNAAGYNYQTSYTYDVLGNLRQVVQGAQTRTFDYSSLSRLTSATNPEVCRQEQAQCVPAPVTYEYDGNGNLKKKTDPRLLPNTQTHINITYDYDALNRLVSRTYNDGTPDVAYTYDSQPLPAGAPAFERGLSAGRLVAVTYGGGALGSYTGGYDALGRIKLSRQVTDTATAEGVKTYPLAYDYYIDGRLKAETYPSGRVIETQYDAAGRVAGVRKPGGGHYAGGDPGIVNNAEVIKYAAHGAISALKLGNGLWERTSFNSRLQSVQIGLGASVSDPGVLQLTYGYGPAGQNNGNVRTQTITVPGTAVPFTQTYAYDGLNRLEMAEEQAGAALTWRQVYSYDRYGNRTLTAGTTHPARLDTATNPEASPDTNRVTSAGYSYDEAGNLLCDPQHACAQSPFVAYYGYDAENRLVTAGGGHDDGGTTYSYNGEGQRVRKTRAGGEVTAFVYDATGRLVADYSNRVEANGTSYLTQDHLGSTRALTDAEGNAHSDNGARGARHDYLPFGEEIGAGVGGRTQSQGYSQLDGVRMKFTGHERDEETGLDYMKARYYSSTQGRFTSVDPSSKSIIPTNPQTWNRYTYTYNNPLRYVDKNGKWPTETHDKIIGAAFNRLGQRQPDKLRQIQAGSASIDRDLKRPVRLVLENTLVESMAPRHAMTPGAIVRKLGSVSAAQDWSRGEATNFINDRMGEAKQINDNSRNKSAVPDAALYAFGQGSHPITDGQSPAHRDFQVYDLAPYKALFAVNPVLGIVAYDAAMDAHTEEESRAPTQDEMNHMVDDLRMQYLNTFGREMYEQAVSPEEREATERRRNPRR
jgi:RHS repeat-associated protein